MRKTIWIAMVLANLGVIVAVAAQTPAENPSSELSRLFAAAQRKGLPEAALVPVLESLGRLQAEGLPTERFVERSVECVAKGCDADALKLRAETLERETRTSGALLKQMQGAGLKDGGEVEGRSALEDLADTLRTVPLTMEDLTKVRELLKTDSLSRVLAGADALAHLRIIRLGDSPSAQLLSAVPKGLPDRDIRFLPPSFCMGRRAGLGDADIQQALLKQMATGGSPYDLMQQWAQESGFRGPGCGMGRGQGRGKGGGQGKGPGWGQGHGWGQGRGQGDEGGQGGQGGRGRGR